MRPAPVIVGVNPEGPEHRDALAGGAMLARALDAPLLVANVYAPHRVAQDQSTRHERALETIVRSSDGAVRGLDVEHLACPGGSPAGVLHRLADEHRAQAVVVGSSAHGTWGHVEVGDVSERLLNGGRSAVVVVPRGYAEHSERPNPVGIAYAATPESEDAVCAGVMIARGARAPVELITVFPGHDHMHTVYPETGDELRERLRHELYRRAAGIAEVRASARMLDGDPVETLTRRSRELGLLVLGSRSYGALRAVLLGGVSSRLIHTLACPVMVVPHAPTSGPAMTPASGMGAEVRL